MENTIQYVNSISTGQIMVAVGIVVSLISFIGYKFTKLYFDFTTDFKKHLMDQTNELKNYQAALNQAQTDRIEECIHKIPTHPENDKPV